MKKSTVALLLSVIMAVTSVGTVPAWAAEAPSQETEEAPPQETAEASSQETAEAPSQETEEAPSQETVEAPSQEAAEASSQESAEAMDQEAAAGSGSTTDEHLSSDETPEEVHEFKDGAGFTEEELAATPEAPEAPAATAETGLEIIEEPEAPVTEGTANTPNYTVVKNGVCGDNLIWEWDNEGILTISGTGDMYDFSYKNSPWQGYSFTKAIIKDGVTSIGKFAFSAKEDLENVTIANTVTKIGEMAFAWCYGLKDLTIPNSVTSIDNNAFLNCESLTSVTIPDSVTNMGSGVFENCFAVTSLTISKGLDSLPTRTFERCSSLEYVTIPDNVTSIGQEAFYNCRSLKSIRIPGTVTSIGDNAFEDCWKLAEVEICKGVKSIGSCAFNVCSSLTEIAIPDGVETIGRQAFQTCTSLKDVVIPNSVKSIGVFAFNYDELSDVYFVGTQSEWLSIKIAENNNNLYDANFIFVDDIYDLKYAKVKVSGNGIYNGSPIKPSVNVYQLGTKLTEGTDYRLSYNNNTNAGTATAAITGIGKYRGSGKGNFLIYPSAATKVTLTNVASGIKISWNEVAGAKYYKVYRKYFDNDDSTYTCLFTTSRAYATDTDVKYMSGEKYTYKVVASMTKNDTTGDSPKYRTATGYRLMPVGIESLTNSGAGKMTVTYGFSSASSSGYVVRFGLKKDMSDAKVITVKGAFMTSKTFSGLKKGKTYYVQVRTYKLDNGVRYYSGYCTTKSIKIIR